MGLCGNGNGSSVVVGAIASVRAVASVPAVGAAAAVAVEVAWILWVSRARWCVLKDAEMVVAGGAGQRAMEEGWGMEALGRGFCSEVCIV